MIRSIIAKLSAPSRLSSTISMRSEDFGTAGSPGSPAACGMDASTTTGSRTTNSDPLPGPSLWASTEPPCISTSRFTSVSPIPDQCDQGCRGDEADPCHQQPRPAGTGPADVDRHLSRVGTGDEVRGPKHVEELLVREPPTPLDDLTLHQGNVGCQSPERCGTEPHEEPGDLTHG